MSTYIGFFKHNTELRLTDNTGKIDCYVTPISFTVTVEADSEDEAIDILSNYTIHDEHQGYDSEFEDLLFEWDSYSLQAVIKSLY